MRWNAEARRNCAFLGLLSLGLLTACQAGPKMAAATPRSVVEAVESREERAVQAHIDQLLALAAEGEAAMVSATVGELVAGPSLPVARLGTEQAPSLLALALIQGDAVQRDGMKHFGPDSGVTFSRRVGNLRGRFDGPSASEA